MDTTPGPRLAVDGGAPLHTPGHVPHVRQGPYETGYMLLATLFVAMLMLTNVIGLKLFSLPVDLPVVGFLLRLVERVNQTLFEQDTDATLALTAGLVTYPITFLVTDIVSEVYGRKRADRMVLVGFVCSLMMLGVIWVARELVPHDFWNVPGRWAATVHPDHLVPDGQGGFVGDKRAAQAAFGFAFDAPGTLLFASMTAYLAAQLVDNRLFHFWRRVTAGRHLWFRNNMSTGLSQFVDTLIVNGLFLSLYWEMEWNAIGAVILNVYVVKFLLALLDTPLCYLGVWWTRKLVLEDPRAAATEPD